MYNMHDMKGGSRKKSSMQIAFYVYTRSGMFACIAAVTIATARDLLSRRRVSACAVSLCFASALDLALIFANESTMNGTPLPLDALYDVTQPEFKTLFAVVVLESIWLIVCIYLDKNNFALMITPAIIFIIASFFIVTLMEEGPFKQWCFYTIREIFLIWMLAFSFVHFLRSSPIDRTRLLRQRPLFIATCILVLCIIIENLLLIFVWQPKGDVSVSLLPLYLSERNFSENFLILTFAFYVIEKGYHTFALRSKEPPPPDSPSFTQYVDGILPRYCERHSLTPRERDILRLTLNGKDYQNIATELQLAIGTVKSHTHNILKKTNQSSRQDLIRDFWKK